MLFNKEELIKMCSELRKGNKANLPKKKKEINIDKVNLFKEVLATFKGETERCQYGLISKFGKFILDEMVSKNLLLKGWKFKGMITEHNINEGTPVYWLYPTSKKELNKNRNNWLKNEIPKFYKNKGIFREVNKN